MLFRCTCVRVYVLQGSTLIGPEAKHGDTLYQNAVDLAVTVGGLSLESRPVSTEGTLGLLAPFETVDAVVIVGLAVANAVFLDSKC